MGPGSSPGVGTRIPQAAQQGQKKKKEIAMMIIITNYDYIFSDTAQLLCLEVNNHFRSPQWV